MTTRDRQRVDELFAQAIELPPDARAPFLANACGADGELRAEVESLLEHDARAATGFMHVPDRPPLVPLGIEGGTDPLIGKRIGKYTICRVMAVGGMGVVYEAEQENPKRTVALKMMPLWEDSPSAWRRFEYESQVLAQLRHPNIAQVYEADVWKDDLTGSARPFFVMELVPDAKPITRYAREFNLSLRERIELCQHVCEAVHHGHQRGVIHRDLKPGNILVDANGQAKIIDFGVAKATDSDVAMTTLRTEVGELVGTIQYMSPEQCADPLNLDIRTDVYSLGIMLYELLCDRLPYDVSTLSVPSATRMICETQPHRPSVIHRALRGDLEIILLKALEKDRDRRYQSAADLDRDIRHYLAREPIEARGPSLAASAFVWTRRHPILTTALAAATVGLTILATAWTTVYLAHQRPYRIDLRDNDHEAALESLNGNVVHIWNSLGRNGIRPATIVRLPNETPGRLLFLGFHSTYPEPLRSRLCAYDIDARRYNNPMWTSRIEPEDAPTAEPERGFAAKDFSPEAIFGPFDMFTETPGLEIVATFCHSYSRHAIQVISSNGEVLFQIWHDGGVRSAYWLSEAKLLVLAGTNDEVPWADRGVAGNENQYYPWVVWAVRPVLGQRTDRYVYTGRFKKEDCIAPAWYKCVMPFEQTDAFREISVRPSPSAAQEDGGHFLLAMTYTKMTYVAAIHRQSHAEAGWVVDAEGREGGEPYYRDDAYLRFVAEDKVIPIESYKLGELLPIIGRPNAE